MQTKLTREDAIALLRKYNKEPFHILHGLTVGGVLKWYANELGYGDEAGFWEICGILHDVIEDTPVSLEMLREEGFSETVLSALALLTHDRSVPYMDYIHQLTKSPLAIQVKLHDLHDNLNRDRLGALTLEDERRMEKYKKSQAYLLRFLEEHS